MYIPRTVTRNEECLTRIYDVKRIHVNNSSDLGALTSKSVNQVNHSKSQQIFFNAVYHISKRLCRKYIR